MLVIGGAVGLRRALSDHNIESAEIINQIPVNTIALV